MTIFRMGLSRKEMLFERFFIDLISFFFNFFLSPLIYMARAIFGTYPEIEKKMKFFEISHSSKKPNPYFFLAVNII